MKKIKFTLISFLVFAFALSAQATTAGDFMNSLGVLRGVISSKHIKNNSVKGSDIKDRTIEGIDIKNDTIKGKDVRDGSLKAEDMGEGEILKAIADNSITSAKIQDGTIVNADISGAAAIAYSKLNLTNSIVSGDILDGTIATVDIADNAVTDAKVVNALTIDGGTINNTPIGLTGPSTGAFTTLSSSGLSTLDSLAVTNNATVGGTLGVTGVTTLVGNLNADGGLDVDDAFVVADGGALTTSQAATFNGVLLATNNATLGNNDGDAITVGGGAGDVVAINSSNWNVASSGAANFVSVGAVTPGTGAFTTLSSSGAATLNSLGVTNNATVGGTLGVTGTTNLGGALNVGGITTLTGNLNADGGLDVDNAFVVADGGALTTSQGSTFNNFVDANGSVSLGDNSGDSIVVGGGTTDDVSITDGQWNIASSGAANFPTIGATTPGTGVFTTLGSTGAASFNSLGVTNNALIGGTLGVSGATSLGSTLGVTGATSLSTLSTSGAATLNSLGVTNNATVGGTLGVTGVTTLTGNFIANSNVNLGNGSGDLIVIGGGGTDNVSIVDAQWGVDGTTGDASFAGTGTFGGTLAADSNIDLRDTGAVSGGMIYDGTNDLGDDEIILGDGVDDTIISAGNLEPDAGTENLGSGTSRWSTIFADTLNYSTAITDANAGGTTVTFGDDNAADTVAITANTSIDDAQWSVTAAGDATFADITSSAGIELQGGPLDMPNGSYIANPLAGRFVFADSTVADITLDFAGSGANTGVIITDTVGTGTVTLGDADSDVTVADDLTVTDDASVNDLTVIATLSLPGNAISDADVSDTLTASNFVGTGSTTNAVDLATAEVNGTLADGNVADALTIDGGTIGGVTPAAGTFTNLAANTSMSLPSAGTLPGACAMGDLFVDTNDDVCADAGGGDGVLCVCTSTSGSWTLLLDL